MNEVNEYLNTKAEKLMIYKVGKNEDLMNEVFKYDPRTLESTSSVDISRYAIGISQFLIYFASEVNRSKVLLIQKRRFLDTSVEESDIVKGKLTKVEYRKKVINSSEELKKVKLDADALEQEVVMTENLEKYYIELINAFKRELSRRDKELTFVRDERRF